MIAAIQEQERQRQRSRSAVSGPAFSVPMMPEMGGVQAMSFSSAPSCTVDRAARTESLASTTDLSSYIGRSVGTGQCVALVKAANPTLGPTSRWAGGASVRGNTTLAPGTPIATFSSNDRYANATNGTSHAAIYLGQDSNGMFVLDQWAGSSASVRKIPWNNPGGAPANTGSAFRVVTRA